MNAGPDVERRISDYLAEQTPTRAPDRILPATFERTRHARQRRFGAVWRIRLMNGNMWRIVAVAVIGLLVILGGGIYLGNGSGVPGGPPAATPTPILTRAPAGTPSPAPAASPIPLTQMADGVAGTYEVDGDFAIPGIRFTLPDGWRRWDVAPGTASVTIMDRTDSPGLRPGFLTFATVFEVYPDPCGAPTATSSPRVGTAVDDLVEALTTLKGFRAGPVEDITVGGLAAKSFELLDASAACKHDTLIGMANTLDTNKDSPQRIIVLDVDGQRLVIQSLTFPSSTQVDRDSIDRVIESITFE